MFERRWKCVGEVPGKGYVFRVVDASNQEMTAFSEWWGAQGHGTGFSWAGTLVEFRKNFAPMPTGG